MAAKQAHHGERRLVDLLKPAMVVVVSAVSLLAPSDVILEVAFILVGAAATALAVWWHKEEESKSRKGVSKDGLRVTHALKKSHCLKESATNEAQPASENAGDVPRPPAEATAAYTFEAPDFDGQIEELVPQLRPSAVSMQLAAHLAAQVRRHVVRALPKASVKVVPLITGNPLRGSRRIVSVPEIDIVAVVTDSASDSGSEPAKALKPLLRLCTNTLVYQSSNFRFRRSAFKGPEPKVTLLAQIPQQLRSGEMENITVDFSVNSHMPIHNAALYAEAAKIPGLQDLLLVVKYWAKARGICHASAGHLPPYAWTLLTIYFMQVGVTDARYRVQPLSDLSLVPLKGSKAATPSIKLEGAGMSVAEVDTSNETDKPEGSPEAASVSNRFRDFISFYSQMDWRAEGVSVRLGCRAPPSSVCPANDDVQNRRQLKHEDAVPLQQDGDMARPTIEDPFDSSDVGLCLSAWGLSRLQAEFERASQMLADGAPMEVLSETWEPPERPKPDSTECAEEPKPDSTECVEE